MTMTLSDDAVITLARLCRQDPSRPCAVRICSIRAGAQPKVQLQRDAVHRDGDVTVSRNGVTVFVDRQLAPATDDKVLHAQPSTPHTGAGADRQVFLLLDQVGPTQP
jgi:Fe-S cluster assembly iron-binding protein IscA